ncbi:hypothetical protein EDC96DRAFT_458070 [Choanephora cucurbitarum]|nr:hypothetical protein EDC96DRAFT_458070 [Choanephora cucurbitarum]
MKTHPSLHITNSKGRIVNLLNDDTDCKKDQIKAKRRYHCTEPGCQKSFTTSGHLARHHRIHTGEKNFHCLYPGCPSRFSRQDNMMQHYRTHMSSRSRNHHYHYHHLYQQQYEYQQYQQRLQRQQKQQQFNSQYTYYRPPSPIEVNTNELYSAPYSPDNNNRRGWSSISSTSTASSQSSNSTVMTPESEKAFYYSPPQKQVSSPPLIMKHHLDRRIDWIHHPYPHYEKQASTPSSPSANNFYFNGFP